MFDKSRLKIFKNLKEDNSIIITKPDKGRGVVILNRNDYTQKMLDILQDTSKFKEILINPMIFITKLEDRLNRLLRSIKDKISESTYKKLFASGSRPGILYGLPKIHKPNCPTRPILSAIGTFNYMLAKFLVPLLDPLVTNEFTLANSSAFVKEILKHKMESGYHLASFDVKSLFTNIPLVETVNICVEQLFKDTSEINNLNKKQFENLLNLATKESFFLFNGKYYQQIDGVAMGSPLGPTLANAFLCFHEQKWLSECPVEFRPLYYRRYVDDCFLIFKDPNHNSKFLDYLNAKHPNIEFTAENETDNKLPFLDVLVKKDQEKLVTEVYRKPTFTGLGISFLSFVPYIFKINSISTLVHRCYSLTSCWTSFHLEIQNLREYFINNGFPLCIFDSFVKKFLDNLFLSKPVVSTVKKERIHLSFPFYGHTSYLIRKELKNLFNNVYPQLDVRFVFKNTFTIGSFFKCKDKVPDLMCSDIIYKYNCSSCNAGYIGSSIRTLHQRVSEHRGVSFRTNKFISNPSHSEIRNHALQADHVLKVENFSILDTVRNRNNLRILESLYIFKMKPSLNSYDSSETLYTM